MNKYKMGVIPDEKDKRDFKIKALNIPVKYADKIDLSVDFPTIFSQNTQGSCTSNAFVAVLEYLYYKITGIKLILSRQFHYNNERLDSGGSLFEDSGATMRQICKTAKKHGCCLEDLFTYGNGNEFIKPSQEAYENAKQYSIDSYYRCEDVDDILYALNNKLPVLLGIKIYDSFYSTKKDGVVPMPKDNENYLGGHAVVVVGYEFKNKYKNNPFMNLLNKIFKFYKPELVFKVRNSWGKSIKMPNSWGYAFNNPSDSGFGKNGYFYLTKDALKALLMDMWVITGVGKVEKQAK